MSVKYKKEQEYKTKDIPEHILFWGEIAKGASMWKWRHSTPSKYEEHSVVWFCTGFAQLACS